MSTTPVQTHFVFDEASLDRQAKGAALEAHRAKTEASARQALEVSKIIDERDQTNMEKQGGKRLSRTDFEKRLQKLVPALRFDTNHLTDEQAAFLCLESGSSSRRVFYERADGTMQYLAAYQNHAVLPEYQILLTRTRRVPAPILEHRHMRAADGSMLKVPFIDGADIPKDPLAKGERPGEREVKEPAGSLVGWRTVLAKLIVEHRLISVDDAEREFRAGERVSWAAKVGKVNEKLLV